MVLSHLSSNCFIPVQILPINGRIFLFWHSSFTEEKRLSGYDHQSRLTTLENDTQKWLGVEGNIVKEALPCLIRRLITSVWLEAINELHDIERKIFIVIRQKKLKEPHRHKPRQSYSLKLLQIKQLIAESENIIYQEI